MSTPEITKPASMTHAEWMAEGTRLYGSDQMAWRFVCPSCGTVATAHDWKRVGAPVEAVAFSCIGRWMPKPASLLAKGKGPCDYAGGGLFRLNPVTVEGSAIFAFADAEPVAKLNAETLTCSDCGDAYAPQEYREAVCPSCRERMIQHERRDLPCA